MPHLAKPIGRGVVWWAFTRWFSRADPQPRLGRKLDVLVSLHAGTRFTDLEIIPSTWTDEAVADLKQHINADWFGLQSDGDGGWSDLDGLDDPPTGRGVGGWANWWGRAEPVTREVVIRALEVSLGVDHHAWNPDEPVTLDDYGLAYDAAPPRNWPIDFAAAAPAATFGASISWAHDRDDPQRGQVSVVWTVPGDGTPLASAVADDDPVSAGTRFGSWVVGQETHEVVAYETWAPSPRGEWPPPIPTIWSHGSVVTEAPDLLTGGVDPDADF